MPRSLQHSSAQRKKGPVSHSMPGYQTGHSAEPGTCVCLKHRVSFARQGFCFFFFFLAQNVHPNLFFLILLCCYMKG